MVILTLLHPHTQTPIKQWCFQTEPLIRIGRALENHVVLDDLLVSRHHLDLRRVDRSQSVANPHQPCWHLVNHSANGTFVNGKVMAQSMIVDDVVLQLAHGGPLLKVQLAPPTLTPSLNQLTPNQSTPGQPMTAHPPSLPKSPQLPSLPKPARHQQTDPGHICTHQGNAPGNLFCIHCGQPVTVEKTIRQYQVLRVLGRGGMGTTYLVWHPTAAALLPGQPQAALRVLKEMNADMARIPKAQELFEREAATLRTLSHIGIPKFYDFFLEAGKKYLVMELLHGQDLEKRVRRSGPVAPPQAIAWMIQTCEILDYLHSREVPIIHRDIKPGNLLVQAVTNRVVVLDFGAVKAVGLPSGTRIGAEGYAAPEQAQGRPVTQSDLYAIGPSLIFLITGENPTRFLRRRGQHPGFDLDSVPVIAPSLRRVIERVTQPRPSDRHRTARDLAHALTQCLETH